MDHVYSKDEAQRIVDAFPSDKLDELTALATSVKNDPALVLSHTPISLPDGWEYQVFGNAIAAAYQDGEQERKTFFIPHIFIEFWDIGKIEAKKSIIERFAIGYCSCGKRMPFFQACLWATDMVERQGFWSLPSKAIGYPVGMILAMWLLFDQKQQWSMVCNRHYTCL